MQRLSTFRAGLFRWAERQTGDWAISRKLLLVFGAFSLFAAIAMLIVAGGLLTTRDAFGEVGTLAAVERSMAEANTAMRDAQGRVKDYVINPSDELAARVEQDMKEARASLASSRGAAEDVGLARQLGTLQKHLQEERAAFDEIRRAQTRIEGRLAPVLDELGPKIGERLAAIVSATHNRGNHEASYQAAQALDDYSQARINVNRFRSTSDQNAVAAARANLLDLEDELNRVFEVMRSDALVQQADLVIENVVEYEQAFTDLVEATERRDANVDGLISEIGPVFERRSAEIAALTQSRFDEATETARSSIRLVVMSLAPLALLGALVLTLGYLGSQHLVEQPVARLADAMRRLASGERELSLRSTDRLDEIGQMTRAFLVFEENAREVERQRAAADEAKAREQRLEEERQRERAAERERAKAEKRRALEEVADAFEASVHKVAAAIGSAARQIEGGAQQVASAANENALVTAEVATTAQQSSQNALAVANASEEMARSIAEVSSQVIESSTRSQSAAERARSTDTIVAGLAEDASKIGEVVELINSIAEQTNLLALNATIEAARAGDAGRGFAVVAGEIKALASQTSKATTQIGERVRGIQTVSADAVRAIEEIGIAIGDIDGIAATVASAVEEQSATTSEIASNTQQAAGGSEMVARNIDRVRSGIEETGAAAEQSLQAAAELSQQAETLQREVDSFLARVRVA